MYLQSEDARTMVMFALRRIPSWLRRLSKTTSSVFASSPLKQSSITSNSLRAKAARAIDFQALSSAKLTNGKKVEDAKDGSNMESLPGVVSGLH
jgi:hypothetical protein